MEKTSAPQAGARDKWPVKKYRLGEEPSDDLSASSTAEERLTMMWELAEQAWLLASRDLPVYDRKTTPGRVLRSRR